MVRDSGLLFWATLYVYLVVCEYFILQIKMLGGTFAHKRRRPRPETKNPGKCHYSHTDTSPQTTMAVGQTGQNDHNSLRFPLLPQFNLASFPDHKLLKTNIRQTKKCGSRSQTSMHLP